MSNQQHNKNMQATIEKLKISNEDLKRQIKEYQYLLESQNSMNEELIATNSDLEAKIKKLTNIDNDMRNLLNSLEIPAIFLDNNLCIKRFTSHITKIVPLINNDIGRSIEDLFIKLKDPILIRETQTVLSSLEISEKEVQTLDGQWYLMRTFPYRIHDNIVNGVVTTFVNISGLKHIEHELIQNISFVKKSEAILKLIVESGEDVITVIDIQGRYLYYSGPERFGLTPDKVVNKTLFDLFDSQAASDFMAQIQAVTVKGESKYFETNIDWRSEKLVFLDYRYPIRDHNGKIYAVGTIGRNITGYNKIKKSLKNFL